MKRLLFVLFTMFKKEDNNENKSLSECTQKTRSGDHTASDCQSCLGFSIVAQSRWKHVSVDMKPNRSSRCALAQEFLGRSGLINIAQIHRTGKVLQHFQGVGEVRLPRVSGKLAGASLLHPQSSVSAKIIVFYMFGSSKVEVSNSNMGSDKV
jgi:hypothetical protein